MLRIKKPQYQRVLEYIQDFGSITTLEAFQDLGCTRLSAKIYDLKKKGYCFDKKTEISLNRYGDKVRYARYYLAEGD